MCSTLWEVPCYPLHPLNVPSLAVVQPGRAQVNEALELLEEMQSLGIEPDVVRWPCVGGPVPQKELPPSATWEHT